MRWLALGLTLAMALGASRPAVAQSASEVAAARRLFRQGLASARGGDWDTAVDRFERSYELAPRPSTLLNLAGAQAQTGQLVAAAESYRRFLDTATDRRSRRLRPGATRELSEIEGRLAYLTLELTGLTGAETIALGDASLSAAALGERLPVDPGAHALVVSRGGQEVLREELTFAEGEAVERRFSVAPDLAVRHGTDGPSSSAPDAALRPDETSEGGDDSGVIIGVVVGVGVAVAAAAIITTVVLVDQSGSPHQGTLGDGVIEFE